MDLSGVDGQSGSVQNRLHISDISTPTHKHKQQFQESLNPKQQKWCFFFSFFFFRGLAQSQDPRVIFSQEVSIQPQSENRRNQIFHLYRFVISACHLGQLYTCSPLATTLYGQKYVDTWTLHPAHYILLQRHPLFQIVFSTRFGKLAGGILLTLYTTGALARGDQWWWAIRPGITAFPKNGGQGSLQAIKVLRKLRRSISLFTLCTGGLVMLKRERPSSKECVLKRTPCKNIIYIGNLLKRWILWIWSLRWWKQVLEQVKQSDEIGILNHFTATPI